MKDAPSRHSRARTGEPSADLPDPQRKRRRRRRSSADLRRRCKAAELQVALEQDVASGLVDQIRLLEVRAALEEETARVLAGQVEALMSERVRLWGAAMGQCRLLSDVDAGERVALAMGDAVPVTTDAVARTFLGMNLYGWLSVPDELVSIFGLQDAVRRWRFQLAQNSRELSPEMAREVVKPYMH